MNPSEQDSDGQIEQLKLRVDQIFKPLSNEVRLKLLFIMSEGPISYTEILEMTGLESGSFYWHIRKMDGLYTQTQDKKYVLNDTGQKVLELIFGKREIDEKASSSFLVSRFLPAVSRINSAPTWFILQQSILFYLLVAGLYNATQLIQIGLVVDFATEVTPFQVTFSIFQWVILIDIWQLLLIQVYFLIRNDPRRPPSTTLLWVFNRNFIFLTPLFLPGIAVGLSLLLLDGNSFVSSDFFQGILVVVSNFIFIFFNILFLIDVFEIELRDALLLSFVSIYPLAIISAFML